MPTWEAALAPFLHGQRLCLDLREKQAFADGHLAHAVHIHGKDALASRFSTLPARGVAFVVLCADGALQDTIALFQPPERWDIVGVFGLGSEEHIVEGIHPGYAVALPAFAQWAQAHGIWRSGANPRGADDAPALLFAPAPVVARACAWWDARHEHGTHTLLDVGCGAGRDATFLLARGQTHWHATTMDRWRAALERAKVLLEDNGLLARASVLEAAITDTGALRMHDTVYPFSEAPLPHAMYDMVLLIRYWNMALLQHIPKRVAPGGLVVLSHFVHEPRSAQGLVVEATLTHYDTPPIAARIQPGDIECLCAAWQAFGVWHVLENRIEPIEDKRPVQSVLFYRSA
ncbi:hypothetical protein MVES1_000506 [Malassezia vespertilionis]|uniref:Rhodanese domain-containing protein n=1 Tax=Malassezia vespertilionis TaxID=2020962 RepID=A0A2N1JG82_9BASI|nr:uncharacterized protein MVES1_000506 [Malassezia vespertilionis]PKI85562.1 hypothetical protein MVES_000467 [Malassezia vespertilionis]WFD05180.1 hypothetical protein MVES1_000506 [Malassezia vespertilionis]